MELRVSSPAGAVTIWDQSRLLQDAVSVAAPTPEFVQLRQRNVSVCLRLSANGETFTFLSPDEDVTSKPNTDVSQQVLDRDPAGSLIAATSTESTPACAYVAPSGGESRW